MVDFWTCSVVFPALPTPVGMDVVDFGTFSLLVSVFSADFVALPTLVGMDVVDFGTFSVGFSVFSADRFDRRDVVRIRPAIHRLAVFI